MYKIKGNSDYFRTRFCPLIKLAFLLAHPTFPFFTHSLTHSRTYSLTNLLVVYSTRNMATVTPGTISRIQGGDTEFKPVLKVSE
jgi:hypothetical protein